MATFDDFVNHALNAMGFANNAATVAPGGRRAASLGTGLTFNGGRPVPQPEYGRTHVYGPGTEGGYPLIPDPNPINNPARVPIGTSLAGTFEYGQPGRDALPSGYVAPNWANVDPHVANSLVNQWMWIGSPAFNAMTDAQKASYLGPNWKAIVANPPAAPAPTTGARFMANAPGMFSKK